MQKTFEVQITLKDGTELDTITVEAFCIEDVLKKDLTAEVCSRLISSIRIYDVTFYDEEQTQGSFNRTS